MIYNQFFYAGINVNGNQNFVHCEAVMYKSIHTPNIYTIYTMYGLGVYFTVKKHFIRYFINNKRIKD